jgi:hypothetical protein
METADLVENAFAMPLTSRSFPRVPYRYRTAAISSSPTTSRSGGADVMIVLLALALYAAAGVAVAAAFLVFGVTRVLPEPAPVTLGARIVLFPSVAALWPYVLIRWLKSSQ